MLLRLSISHTVRGMTSTTPASTGFVVSTASDRVLKRNFPILHFLNPYAVHILHLRQWPRDTDRSLGCYRLAEEIGIITHMGKRALRAAWPYELS